MIWQKRTLINKSIKFCIKGSLVVVFDIFSFANINFMGKKKEITTRCVCETQMPPVATKSKYGKNL